MAAVIQIDQVGLPAGAAGFARTDGLSNGAQVTLASTGGGTTHRFELLAVPEGDNTAEASLAQATPTTWTFTPTAGVYGSYRIRLIVDEGLATQSSSTRIFGIRTPNLGLLIPAWNELSDPRGSLLNDGATVVDASENNESSATYPAGDPRGWFPGYDELVKAVDGLGGGASSLQDAYDGGNTIATTLNREVSISDAFASADPLLDLLGSHVGRTGPMIRARQHTAGEGQIPVIVLGTPTTDMMEIHQDGLRGPTEITVRPSTGPNIGDNGFDIEIVAGLGRDGNGGTPAGDGGTLFLDAGENGANGGGGPGVQGNVEIGRTAALNILSGRDGIGSAWQHEGNFTVLNGDIALSALRTVDGRDVSVDGATLDAHVANVANPHATTAAQVGAPPTARALTAGAGLTGGGDLSADRTFDVVANADGSIVVNPNDVQVGVLASDAQHGNRGGGGIHAAATVSTAGFMSATDKDLVFERRSHTTWNYEFYNALTGTHFQSNVSGAGASISGRASEAGHPGVTEVAAGTTTTGSARIINNVVANTYLLTDGTTRLAAIVRVPTLADVTEDYEVAFGLGTSLAVDPTNGVVIAYQRTVGANWQCRTRDGVGTTLTDSGVPVTTSWFYLEIEINAAGTSVAFKINGATVQTHATNIPAACSTTLAIITKTAGTTSRSLYVDYMGLDKALTTPR